jgi:hypothetical protein
MLGKSQVCFCGVRVVPFSSCPTYHLGQRNVNIRIQTNSLMFCGSDKLAMQCSRYSHNKNDFS